MRARHRIVFWDETATEPGEEQADGRDRAATPATASARADERASAIRARDAGEAPRVKARKGRAAPVH